MTPHAHHDSRIREVAVCVLTVSDTRDERSDRSGALIRQLLEDDGHRVHDQRIVPDEPDRVASVLAGWLEDDGCEAILITGGTGISARDRTREAIDGLLDRRLPGFGELFRVLSFEEIGSAAMLSRAVGGIARGKPVFSIPGSTPAVRLALTRLILPELPHLLSELRK